MQSKSYVSLGVVGAMLLALTLIGSIWDYEIASFIYLGQMPEKNIFGIIFSYVGIIPTFVGWSFLGASIICLSKKHVASTKKRRLLIAFAALLFVLSFFYFCNTLYLSNANAFEVNFFVAYLIGIAVICAAATLGYKLSERCADRELLKKLLLLAAVSLVTLLIISVTKELMCRPRFRFVLYMENPDYFRSFWQSGSDIRDSLGRDIVTDEFASMPSGHSAYSMFAIFLFPTLSDYVKGLGKFRPYLFASGLVWWALTALSRMSVGAHYLTDVTVAGLVTLISYVAVSLIDKAYRRRVSLSKV